MYNVNSIAGFSAGHACRSGVAPEQRSREWKPWYGRDDLKAHAAARYEMTQTIFNENSMIRLRCAGIEGGKREKPDGSSRRCSPGAIKSYFQIFQPTKISGFSRQTDPVGQRGNHTENFPCFLLNFLSRYAG